MGRWSLVFALFASPLFAHAHTRWFAHEQLPSYVANEPTGLYVAVWAAIIAGVVAVGVVVHKCRLFELRFLEPKKPHAFERAASTFTMVSGAFFVIAGTHEYLFSPNLIHETGIPEVLVVIQIVIGLAFLLGIGTRTAAIALAALWASAFYYAGWVVALEDVWVLSTAAFIAIMGNDYFSLISFSMLRRICEPCKRYALSILRLGTGATLMVVGLSEKMLAPEYGMHFLSLYEWNFMQMLGFEYSDYLFTLSAGAVEFLFGLIFVLGIVTRLNALVVATVFTIPMFLLGPIELAGHLPHFAAIILLLLFGGGEYFVAFRARKKTA